MIFADRREAGRRLGERLAGYAREGPVVLALPRGGVPVGFEVARNLGCPWDVVVARKLGAPRQPDLAIGAVAAGGEPLWNEELLASLGVPEAYRREEVRRQSREARRQEAVFRSGRAAPRVAGSCAIVVDDGVATGLSVRAALEAARRLGPRRLVAAFPVGSAEGLEGLRPHCDELVCLLVPGGFISVSDHYADFRPTSDSEVLGLLGQDLK